jgi:transposase
MANFLLPDERKHLEKMHRKEANRKKADRLKAILGADDGKSHAEIAEIIRVDEATVRRHVDDYIASKKKSNDSGGSGGKLTLEQKLDFQGKLASGHVPNVAKAMAMAFEFYGVAYSASGMTDLLHSMNFSYKKPEGLPAKADPSEQEKWLEDFMLFLMARPSNEPAFYFDAFHPAMTTKIGYGWSLKGAPEIVETTGAKTRVNVVGSLNLSTLNMVSTFPDWVNSETVEEHFEAMRKQYPRSFFPTLRLVLDQGPYCKSQATKDAAKKHGIELRFLPPYSPNLNLIERAWKVANEKVRNNVFFADANTFTSAIKDFFQIEWSTIRKSLAARFAMNFQVLKPTF